MPSYQRTQTGTGGSNPVYLDTVRGGPVGFQCIATGTVTYTIQHSQDQTTGGAAPTNWFDDTNVVGKTASAEGNFIVPVQWMRINVTAGTGAVALTAVQTILGS